MSLTNQFDVVFRKKYGGRQVIIDLEREPIKPDRWIRTTLERLALPKEIVKMFAYIANAEV